MPRQIRKSGKEEPEESVASQATNSTAAPSGPALVPEHILGFLNALPMTGDSVEWINAFREALKNMLGDVDRVAVQVNLNCDLQNPGKFTPRVDITQHSTMSRRAAETVVMTAHWDGQDRAEKMIEEFRQMGYPLDDYHAPHSFSYHFGGKAYLGSLILFRERTKQPISDRTLAAMAVMESFFVFALSDLVTRHYYERPIDRVFGDILKELEKESGLSVQDTRILSLMLLGYSYKQVADRMDLSIDTIRKHMKRIYRKTRTGSLAELFAKYFTPRLGIEALGEDNSL